MKRLALALTAALLLTFAGAARASGPCTPGPNWTQSWTDAFGQTMYSISAPPCVYVNVPFNIVVTVTDSTWPDNTVGSSWKVLDNGATVDSGTVITTSGGTWQMTIPVTYTVLVVNHSIQFQFMDFGDTADAGHFWPLSQTPIGGTTVDPYPPEDPPVDPPVTDPPPTDPPNEPAIGCASAGGEAGLLAILAAAMSFRRRRRA